MWIDTRGSEVLGLTECRRLLALAAKERRHGHLGISTAGLPSVLPVDYAFDGHDVLVMVGDRLLRRLAGQITAFQIDGLEWSPATGGHHPWSVLLCGPAVEEDATMAAVTPFPRVSTPGHRLVRIRGHGVTGRRLGANLPPPEGQDGPAVPSHVPPHWTTDFGSRPGRGLSL